MSLLFDITPKPRNLFISCNCEPLVAPNTSFSTEILPYVVSSFLPLHKPGFPERLQTPTWIIKIASNTELKMWTTSWAVGSLQCKCYLPSPKCVHPHRVFLRAHVDPTDPWISASSVGELSVADDEAVLLAIFPHSFRASIFQQEWPHVWNSPVSINSNKHILPIDKFYSPSYSQLIARKQNKQSFWWYFMA